MARKKGTPQKAPEYKNKAPGKAKDGSTCYTRQGNKGAYVTCTGTQKSSAKAPVKATEKQKELMRKRREAAKAKKPKTTIGGRPAGLKVKVGTLNKGKIIKATPLPKAPAKTKAPAKAKAPAKTKKSTSVEIDFDTDRKGDYWHGTLRGEFKGKNKILIPDYGGVLTKGYAEDRANTFKSEPKRTANDRKVEINIITRFTPKQRSEVLSGEYKDDPNQFFFGKGADFRYGRRFYQSGEKLIEFDRKHGDMKTGGPPRPDSWRSGAKTKSNPPGMEEFYKKNGRFPPMLETFSYETIGLAKEMPTAD